MVALQNTFQVRNEVDLQTSNLRSLWQVIYHQEASAWSKWMLTCHVRGFQRALVLLEASPAHYGALQGQDLFGYMKDQKFRRREQALLQVTAQASRWHVALMQLEQHETRQRNARRAP